MAAGLQPAESPVGRTTAAQATIRDIVEEVSHLLPSQSPLHAFVHHNTLHAFEDLPFDEAVVAASEIFGTEPFPTEEAFAASIREGRIEERDLHAVAGEARLDPALTLPGGISVDDFVVGRLRNLFEVSRGNALLWQLSEGGALRRFHSEVSADRRLVLLEQARAEFPEVDEGAAESRLCRRLWQTFEEVADVLPSSAVHSRRPRDLVYESTGVDLDRWVHPVLRRLCAAFLDQGISYWTMPGRDRGLLETFRRLYGLKAPPPDRWMRGLPSECRRQQRESWSADRTIEWALDDMGVEVADTSDVIRRTLLSLRGWAGMFNTLESNPDLAPVQALPARLLDYLAVQLFLDAFALRALREGVEPNLARGESPRSGGESSLPLAYEAFVAAQILPVDVRALVDPQHARVWLDSVAELDSTERRRLLHLAYERRYRNQILDGLIANEKLLKQLPPLPEFQAVFCIDDREESLRRHLEEVFPACETYGYAGFFGVAMLYKGLDDVRARPLCPVSISPTHLVVEKARDADQERRYRAQRKRAGKARHATVVGSKSLLRGSLFTAAAGIASVVPLIGRCLFPRQAERLSHHLFSSHKKAPPTRLQVVRDEDAPVVADGGIVEGYSVDEMEAIVESFLTTTAIAQQATPLVLIVGHGSSSLNNPHEAAHDCGATGGGRGGPNARAFAMMANHPEVRQRLIDKGIGLPRDCWFVGSYHNTCDDSMTYFDEDLVPTDHLRSFARLKTAMATACARDAHERCRRFETSPLSQSFEEALVDAEVHSADLAQPRPEYGHATNAACIVGRRSRTRGLFLDRRVFLVSYDPTTDSSGETLENLLLSVGPVCAGINLEYYFSFVDPSGYGSGTKLPHNIVALLGVMDGHQSDLRTGLPWQMVEIHEPLRLLLVVEAEPEVLTRLIEAHPPLARLTHNDWIQLVSWSPENSSMRVYTRGEFREYEPEELSLQSFASSAEYYGTHRGHLRPAHLSSAFGEPSRRRTR